MASGKSIQPTKYAQHKYNLTKPIDFEVGVKYAQVLMAIAGADGELAAGELQWYIDEQELLMDDATEYIEAVRKLDWKNADIEELLSGIKYDFPLNFRRTLLYQAIKMCRADGTYHAKEKTSVAKAAELLGIDRSMVVSLASLAELEEAAERLRLALFEKAV